MLAIAVFIAALLPAACSALEYRTGQPVMGTILQVTVIAADGDKARRAADAAIGEVQHWDDVLTVWRESGELAALNRNSGSGPQTISRALYRSLEQMLALNAQTSGAFDPAVGPLVALWGNGAVPTRDAIERAAPFRLRAALTLGRETAALAKGAVLDPGAVGKGIGLDAAVDVLRRTGVEAALLDFGGSSQTAIGAPPGSPEGWPIAVAGLGQGEVRGVVALRDASLSTTRWRGRQSEDGRIVDPRSGVAVEVPRLATVRARTATAADAWSTALVVLGRGGIEKARQNGVEVFFEDGAGAAATVGFGGREKSPGTY
jgi:thiamine biosynthesis lipoprotein